MLRSIAVVALLLACIAAPLGAQDRDTVPDIPPRPAGLPSKVWERALVRAVRPTPAGVKWQMNVSESVVEGETLPEVSARIGEASERMRELRGGRSPGSFAWTMSTPWQMEVRVSRCEFRTIEVRMGIDVDVVLLGGPVAQDSATTALWERQLDRMWDGHVQRMRLMRDYSRELYEKIRFLNHQSCPELANMAYTHARTARIALNNHLAALGVLTTPMNERIP